MPRSACDPIASPSGNDRREPAPYALLGTMLGRLRLLVVLGVIIGVVFGFAGSVQAGASTAPSFPDHVSGPIHAPGGPFLYDRYGRVVIFHGVNVVYKRPPFEVQDVLGKPWSFTASDAAKIASLGFNVVRLGILWEGLEPGTLGPNSPQVCDKGPPGDPHQFNQALFNAYISQVVRVVDLLGSYHIYTLLDMHQDVYNQLFGGEGAPAWAVCTDGLPVHNPPGRWSQAYREPAVGAAYANFWTNDVIGNLQGNYDHVWQLVAATFRDNPYILGYDPFNEPFSQLWLEPHRINTTFDAELECFYTGKALPGYLLNRRVPLTCPTEDPQQGLIPTIEQADPNHLIFYEPPITASGFGIPGFLGAMPYPNLVMNFHDYCGFRNATTGNPMPGFNRICAYQIESAIEKRMVERKASASSDQPGGPAWFMSEFGATNDSTILDRTTAFAGAHMLGWTYWSWEYYDDPTGSSDEALMEPDGRLLPKVDALARTYAQAIAGQPLGMSFDPSTGAFHITWLVDPRVHAPTSIFVPVRLHYPGGYCVRSAGAKVISPPDTAYVLADNLPGSTRAEIWISAGSCH